MRRHSTAIPPSPGLGLVVLISVLTSAITVVTINLLMGAFTGGGKVSVPALVGMNTAQGRIAAGTAGLKMRQTNEVFDPVVEKGYIARQSPIAGSSLPMGGVISVTVSKGDQRVAVPSLKQVPLAEALQRLKKHGLRWGRTEFQDDDAIPAGSVIATQPSTGTMVNPGTMVRLIVARKAAVAKATTPGAAPPLPAAGAAPTSDPLAKGRVTSRSKTVAVPKVEGVRLQYAVGRLRARGLVKGRVTYGRDEDHMEDFVLQQTPAPGARVPRGSAVDLQVNKTD